MALYTNAVKTLNGTQVLAVSLNVLKMSVLHVVTSKISPHVRKGHNMEGSTPNSFPRFV